MLFGFYSRMDTSPWGGSEELWSQAAIRLKGMGHDVTACVQGWDGERHPGLLKLEGAGVEVSYRPRFRPPKLWQRALRKLSRNAVGGSDTDWTEQLAARRPELVIISEGGNDQPRDLCLPFITKNIPFALLMQAAAEAWWPTDHQVEKAATIFQHARAAFFVSEANRRLTKMQYLGECRHAEVIRNPFNVSYDIELPWPEIGEGMRVAFVGRLEPEAKGCDILLDMLSAARWRERRVTITFYGEGHSSGAVRSYAKLLGLENVNFEGHVKNIEDIWRRNHLLALPSRREGLPLAIVEAMLCRRPCVVTDVAGNPELIEDNVTGFVAGAATVRHFDEAMERAWAARDQWKEIGCRAGESVRRLVPRDPAGIFAEKLVKLASHT